MPFDDPIVKEVRKSRELLIEKYQFDFNKFFKFIKDEENKNPEKLAKFPAGIKLLKHTTATKDVPR